MTEGNGKTILVLWTLCESEQGGRGHAFEIGSTICICGRRFRYIHHFDGPIHGSLTRFLIEAIDLPEQPEPGGANLYGFLHKIIEGLSRCT